MSTQTEDYYDLTEMVIQQARVDTTLTGQVQWQLEDLNTIKTAEIYGFELSWKDSFVRRLSKTNMPIGNTAYACDPSYHASLLVSDIKSIRIFSLTNVNGLFSEQEDVSDYFKVSNTYQKYQSDSSSIFTFIIAAKSSVYKDFPIALSEVVMYLDQGFMDGQQLQFQVIAELEDGREFTSKTKKIRVEN